MVLKEMTLDEKIDLLHGMGMPGLAARRAESSARTRQRRRRLRPRHPAPRHSLHSDERRRLRRARQRRKWPLLHRASRQRRRRRKLGSRGRLLVRHADRPRTSRAGLQHDARRRHQPHARAAQRPHLRVPRRRSASRRHARRQPHEVRASRNTSSATSSTTPSTIRRPAASSSTSIIGKRAMRESDLLAFQIGVGIADPGAVMCSYNARQRRLRLRKQIPPHRRPQERLGLQRLRRLRLGRHAQHRQSLRRWPRQRRTARRLFRRETQRGRRSRRSSQAELDEHVHRILRTEFASGIVDDPPQKGVVDVLGGSRNRAEDRRTSVVLLKNDKDIFRSMPLAANRSPSSAGTPTPA